MRPGVDWDAAVSFHAPTGHMEPLSQQLGSAGPRAAQSIPRAVAHRSVGTGGDTPSTSGRGLRVGDSIIIQSNHVNPELAGQEGVVTRLDLVHGWIELQIPKLGGRTVVVQQRHVAQTPTAGNGSPPGLLGMPGEDGRLPGGLKRQGSCVRNGTAGLPPAKVPASAAPGTPRQREVLRAVRKALSSLEENTPWDAVEGTWRNKRGNWRKALRNLDPILGCSGTSSTRPPEAAVPALAACILELHDTLQTDKGSGFWARGGAWDTRLNELRDGGNSSSCLQLLFDQFNDAVMAWLAKGDPDAAAAKAVERHGPLSPGSSGGKGRIEGMGRQVAWALDAMETAVASKDPGQLTQVPLHQILGPGREGREGVAALQGALDRELASTRARLEAAKSGGLPPLLGRSLGGLAERDAEALGLAGSPSLRAELAAHRHQPHHHHHHHGNGNGNGSRHRSGRPQGLAVSILAVESEMDTDVDCGGEATDLEDAD